MNTTSSLEPIPFFRETPSDRTAEIISEFFENFHSQIGGGDYTRRCVELVANYSCVRHSILTPSCTDALELAALLSGIGPEDEVILPSWTFTSTANAFLLRGAKLIFCDIDPNTLNIDTQALSSLISERTKVICTVDYGGVPCDYREIFELCRNFGLFLICDAAQSFLATSYMSEARGFRFLGCLSFHGTKNISCGEGGALLINDTELFEKAEIIRDKGTNRSQFLRGAVDRYTWQSIGSSFIMNELTAAYLYAQLLVAESATSRRVSAWKYYSELLADFANDFIIFPPSPSAYRGNGHTFFGFARDEVCRGVLIDFLSERGIRAQSHYEPLHSSPHWLSLCPAQASLPVTENLSRRIFRLPLWNSISRSSQDRVVDALLKFPGTV